MSWANLDDRLHAHPKVRRLQRVPFAGLEAFGVWSWCLSWCRAYSPLHGRVRVEDVADAWNADPEHIAQLFDLLLSTRMVDAIDDDPATFLIHDWSEWQLAGHAQQSLAGKARAATARREGGRFAPNPPASSAGALVGAGTSPATPLHASPNRTSPARVAGELDATRGESEFRRRVPEPGR